MAFCKLCKKAAEETRFKVLVEVKDQDISEWTFNTISIKPRQKLCTRCCQNLSLVGELLFQWRELVRVNLAAARAPVNRSFSASSAFGQKTTEALMRLRDSQTGRQGGNCHSNGIPGNSVLNKGVLSNVVRGNDGGVSRNSMKASSAREKATNITKTGPRNSSLVKTLPNAGKSADNVERRQRLPRKSDSTTFERMRMLREQEEEEGGGGGRGAEVDDSDEDKDWVDKKDKRKRTATRHMNGLERGVGKSISNGVDPHRNKLTENDQDAMEVWAEDESTDSFFADEVGFPEPPLKRGRGHSSKDHAILEGFRTNEQGRPGNCDRPVCEVMEEGEDDDEGGDDKDTAVEAHKDAARGGGEGGVKHNSLTPEGAGGVNETGIGINEYVMQITRKNETQTPKMREARDRWRKPVPQNQSLWIKRVKKAKKVKEVQETFHCDKCPRRHHLKSALEAHLRAHARAEKPKRVLKGACRHCHFSFERLDIHLKLVHGEDMPGGDERPHLCRFCSKAFTRYDSEQPRIGTLLLGHLLVRSHRLLIRLACALHCAHSFAHSLTPELVGK